MDVIAIHQALNALSVYPEETRCGCIEKMEKGLNSLLAGADGHEKRKIVAWIVEESHEHLSKAIIAAELAGMLGTGHDNDALRVVVCLIIVKTTAGIQLPESNIQAEEERRACISALKNTLKGIDLEKEDPDVQEWIKVMREIINMEKTRPQVIPANPFGDMLGDFLEQKTRPIDVN